MDVDRVYRVSKIQQTYRILEEQLKCNNTIHNSPPTKGMVTRRCTENGTWFINPETLDTWTNFTDCIPDQSLSKAVQRHVDNLEKISTAGYSVSLVMLVLAIVFLLRCRLSKPKRTRSKISTLHINLFLSFLLRAAMGLLQNNLFKEIYFRSMDSENNEMWECKLITAFNLYVLVASAFWLSVEAFVLIRLFHNWKYLQIRNAAWNHIAIGWGGPLLLVLPWAISKITNEDEWCWHSHPRTWVNWAFVRGPILFLIIVNEVLFIKILMFLWKRLRKPSSDPQFKSIILAMARHLCILIPLFGISDIVFVLMSFWYDVEYLYAEMLFNSLQGCMLSFTLCFAEKKALQEFRQVCFRGKRTRAMPLRRRNPNLTY
uniref:Pituitary adenylate cyclase-activating polypeptide type I receptor-like isoform X2 n=1 Tax=Crassostrea virginica TaxID=6565 RepID=A0A8B8ELC6_CRAVI|nr:pituitary adenylate cyclase-activating polypeptide type I receptor-like isoform X2 [Crassostrea virginica]